MKEITILIKPASSLCNMRCRYCFYADVSDHRDVKSYGIMDEQTAETVIDAALSDVETGGGITFAFQGGEPTLAGLDYFRHFVQYAKTASATKRVKLKFTMQTNGFLIDDEWCAFLKENDFLVGLSMDGPAEYHNKNRLDAAGKGTWKKISDAADKFKQYGVEFNVLCVLTADNARHPEKLWKYFLQKGIRYLQFIPCLPDLGETQNRFSLTPTLFCEFYTILFRLWKEELQKGNYISVKLFDDLANMLVFRRLTACGLNGSCNLQYIVEADGSVYPCDFYVLDEYKLGNLKEDSMEDIRENFRGSSFHELRKEMPEICRSCKYIKLCNGGCVRLRQSMYIKDDYCGYQELSGRIGDPLIQAVNMLA